VDDRDRRREDREHIKAGESLETAVPDAVGAFDSVARQYAKQLAKWVPMKPEWRVSLEGALFHNLKKAEDLKAWFGIDIFQGLGARDGEFIRHSEDGPQSPRGVPRTVSADGEADRDPQGAAGAVRQISPGSLTNLPGPIRANRTR
jgi:hypothetical protein